MDNGVDAGPQQEWSRRRYREGPPRLSFRFNPPIFFGETLPCEQQNEETGDVIRKIETRGLDRVLSIVPPVPDNHICDPVFNRYLVRVVMLCEDVQK